MYYSLKVKCKVHPDFLEFYEKKLIHSSGEEYDALPKKYRDVCDNWESLHLCKFLQYTFEDGTLNLELFDDGMYYVYVEFLKDIIVPTTTEIMECEITDLNVTTRVYTDLELRGKRLDLQQLIRSVHHVWEEGCISETRVVYKRGIPASQELDLTRLFGQQL